MSSAAESKRPQVPCRHTSPQGVPPASACRAPLSPRASLPRGSEDASCSVRSAPNASQRSTRPPTVHPFSTAVASSPGKRSSRSDQNVVAVQPETSAPAPGKKTPRAGSGTPVTPRTPAGPPTQRSHPSPQAQRRQQQPQPQPVAAKLRGYAKAKSKASAKASGSSTGSPRLSGSRRTSSKGSSQALANPTGEASLDEERTSAGTPTSSGGKDDHTLLLTALGELATLASKLSPNDAGLEKAGSASPEVSPEAAGSELARVSPEAVRDVLKFGMASRIPAGSAEQAPMLEQPEDSTSVLRALNTLARSLEMEAVAEMVHDQEAPKARANELSLVLAQTRSELEERDAELARLSEMEGRRAAEAVAEAGRLRGTLEAREQENAALWEAANVFRTRSELLEQQKSQLQAQAGAAATQTAAQRAVSDRLESLHRILAERDGEFRDMYKVVNSLAAAQLRLQEEKRALGERNTELQAEAAAAATAAAAAAAAAAATASGSSVRGGMPPSARLGASGSMESAHQAMVAAVAAAAAVQRSVSPLGKARTAGASDPLSVTDPSVQACAQPTQVVGTPVTLSSRGPTPPGGRPVVYLSEKPMLPLGAIPQVVAPSMQQCKRGSVGRPRVSSIGSPGAPVVLEDGNAPAAGGYPLATPATGCALPQAVHAAPPAIACNAAAGCPGMPLPSPAVRSPRSSLKPVTLTAAAIPAAAVAAAASATAQPTRRGSGSSTPQIAADDASAAVPSGAPAARQAEGPASPVLPPSAMGHNAVRAYTPTASPRHPPPHAAVRAPLSPRISLGRAEAHQRVANAPDPSAIPFVSFAQQVAPATGPAPMHSLVGLAAAPPGTTPAGSAAVMPLSSPSPCTPRAPAQAPTVVALVTPSTTPTPRSRTPGQPVRGVQTVSRVAAAPPVGTVFAAPLSSRSSAPRRQVSGQSAGYFAGAHSPSGMMDGRRLTPRELGTSAHVVAQAEQRKHSTVLASPLSQRKSHA